MAKEIASLHMLSGGRFELGVGVGWDAREFAVAGVKLSERGGRTDEILDIFDRLWTGEEVTHQGRYYRFERVTIDPPLPTRPWLWLAGGSKMKSDLSPDPETMAPTVLERICRRADGWLARAAGSNDSVIADWRQITRRLDEIGRPRGSVTFAHVNMTHVVPTDDEAAAHKIQRPLIERVMGTHRAFDHLRTCYLLGSPRHIREPHRRTGSGRARVPCARAARLRSRPARSVGGRVAAAFPCRLTADQSHAATPRRIAAVGPG